MIKRFDLMLLAATIALGVCGYLAQSSTAQALASPAHATRHLAWLISGGGAMIAVAFVDYRVLARFSPLFYLASLAVLIVLLAIAPLRAGTRSWIVIGSYTIQPSEFARIATILAVAAFAAEHRADRLDGRVSFRLAGIVAAPALLVALQPDLGMALTFVPILLAALWLGGMPWRVWAAIVLGTVLVAGIAWVSYLKPYQQERILTFLDSDRAPYGAGYQQRQSKVAVGSGEVTGRGLHLGTQSQLRFLPAQHTDFIFAVWAEETGFIGSIILLGAYGLLISRILLVAVNARDRVGALFAGCAGGVLATQIAVNVAMVTGLAPTTGITLPIVSHGGSSILAVSLTLGIVHSIWRLRFANA